MINAERFQQVYDNLSRFGLPGYERIAFSSNNHLPYTTRFTICQNVLYYIKRLFCCGGNHPYERVARSAQPVLQFFQTHRKFLGDQHLIGLTKLSHLSSHTKPGFEELIVSIFQQNQTKVEALEQKQKDLQATQENIKSQQQHKEDSELTRVKQLETGIGDCKAMSMALQEEIQILQAQEKQLLTQEQMQEKADQVHWTEQEKAIEECKKKIENFQEQIKEMEEEMTRLNTELSTVTKNKEELEKRETEKKQEVEKKNSEIELKKEFIQKMLKPEKTRIDAFEQAYDAKQKAIQKKHKDIANKIEKLQEEKRRIERRLFSDLTIATKRETARIEQGYITRDGIESRAIAISSDLEAAEREKNQIEEELEKWKRDAEKCDLTPIRIICSDGEMIAEAEYVQSIPLLHHWGITAISEGPSGSQVRVIDLSKSNLMKKYSVKTLRIYFRCLEESIFIEKQENETDIFDLYLIADVLGHRKQKECILKQLFKIFKGEYNLYLRLLYVLGLPKLPVGNSLIQRVFKWAAKNFDCISKKRFFDINYEYLIEILKQEAINIDSEEALYKCILSWAAQQKINSENPSSSNIVNVLEKPSETLQESIIDFIPIHEFSADMRAFITTQYEISQEQIKQWSERTSRKKFKKHANKDIIDFSIERKDNFMQLDIKFSAITIKRWLSEIFFISDIFTVNGTKVKFILAEPYKRPSDGITYRSIEISLIGDVKNKYQGAEITLGMVQSSFSHYTSTREAGILNIAFPKSVLDALDSEKKGFVELKIKLTK